MTANEIIVTARQYGGDEKSAQIWDDEQWLRVINEGLLWFWTYRPESRLDTDGTLLTYAEVSDPEGSTELWLDDAFFPALLDFIMARFYRTDAADSRDRARAELHEKQFEKRVGA